MYVVKILIDVVNWTMFGEKDQCHEKSHWARDIGHFRLSPILQNTFFPASVIIIENCNKYVSKKKRFGAGCRYTLVSLRQSIQRLNLRELRIACLTSAF